MEPEAWRCRRTDGRKWRCRMNVVPHHKYCDRHMHRGRHRSRKPLELQPPPPPPPPPSSITHSQAPATRSPAKTSAAPQKLLKHAGPYPPPASLNNKTQNHGGGSKGSTRDGRATVTATHHIVKRPVERSVPSTLTTVAADLWVLKTTAKDRTEATNVPANGDASSNGKVTSGSRAQNNNASQCLDFSPKSVLPVERCFHGDGVISAVEGEPGRCRRTDGKKWRCRTDVVSNQKYCERHLHRGAKRHPEPYPAVPSAVVHQQPKLPRKAECGSLKVTPAIATQTAAPPPVNHGNASTSSTSSDATISDDTFVATGTN